MSRGRPTKLEENGIHGASRMSKHLKRATVRIFLEEVKILVRGVALVKSRITANTLVDSGETVLGYPQSDFVTFQTALV